jgi:hypothetical protein
MSEERFDVPDKLWQIVDASIVQVPIQRNTSEENESIKDDIIPEGWEEDGRMYAQKDTDAR